MFLIRLIRDTVCQIDPGVCYPKVRTDISVAVNGTVGEGVCMSVQERKTVLEAWLEVTRNTSVHVMVQVGGTALRDVQELVSPPGKHVCYHSVKKIMKIN